jgi:DNA modification methylase
MWVWKFVAEQSARLLKPQCSALVLTGWPEECLYQFRQQRPVLQYWWTNGMWAQTSGCAMVWGRYLMSRLKLAAWYTKGKPRQWFNPDGSKKKKPSTYAPCDIIASHREKGAHPWQQSLGWFLYWLKHLSSPGELVLDPFCGGCTTLVACKRIRRRCIGIEIDEGHCEKGAKRLERDTTLGMDDLISVIPASGNGRTRMPT